MSRIENAQRITSLIQSEVELNKLFESRKDFITSGMEPVDAAIKGFRLGELIYIGGRPAMGKSKYLLKSLLRISQNVPVLLYSVENGCRRVANKIISLKQDGGESFFMDHVGKSNIDVDLSNEELYVSDIIYDSIEEYLLFFIKHILERKVKVIAIDDLHLLPVCNGGLNTIELLKEICILFKVTIIVTGTVLPDCELRGGDKKPRLKDVNLEPSKKFDLDIILLLYRPEYYGFIEDQWGNSTSGRLEVIIAKDRENEPFDFTVDCLFTSKEDGEN